LNLLSEIAKEPGGVDAFRGAHRYGTWPNRRSARQHRDAPAEPGARAL